MESTVEEKQQYLRSQILESGYDPNEFVAFVCKDMQVQSIDIENWTMHKLQDIVLKFKQYKFYSQGTSDHKMVVNTKEVKNIEVRKTKIQFEKNSPIFDFQFINTYNCIQAENLLKAKELQIFIPSFEIKQSEGLFFSIGSKTQVWFNLQTNFTKNSTKRLMEDFQWLSKTIIRLFPLSAIPQLIDPEKQSQNSYQKRRKEIQQFMQILAKRQELKTSVLLLDFISISYEKMEKLKKNFDSMGFAKGISAIKNQKGNIQISYSNKLRNFSQSCYSYSKKISPIHEKISESISKAIQYLKLSREEINKIVDHYAELHECYIEVTNKHPESKSSEYSEVLININNLFHVVSDNISNISEAFTTNLQDYYKVIFNYDKNILKINKNMHDYQRQYVSAKKELYRKKQRLFPDPLKWEAQFPKMEGKKMNKEQAFQIMLPKQTIAENEQKLWLAYLLTNFKSEFEKYISFCTKRYANKFCNFTADLLFNNKSFVEELTKFVEETKKLASS